MALARARAKARQGASRDRHASKSDLQTPIENQDQQRRAAPDLPHDAVGRFLWGRSPKKGGPT